MKSHTRIKPLLKKENNQYIALQAVKTDRRKGRRMEEGKEEREKEGGELLRQIDGQKS